MRINSDILKPLTEAEQQERLIDELCTEETYYFIARVYSDLCVQHGAGIYKLLPWKDHNTAARKKRIAEIKKLIRISVELGVPFTKYMRAQFEQQLPFLTRAGLNYVPLRNMISKHGRLSYGYYEERIARTYTRSEDKEQYFTADQLNIRKSLEESMAALASRLQYVANLTELEVVEELDALARRGRVSNLYVFSHRLSGGTRYLKEVSDAVAKKLLDKKTLEKINKVREELLPKFSQHLREYI